MELDSLGDGRLKMQVVELFSQGKKDAASNEDALFVNDCFAAVVDGATSKSSFLRGGKTTGRWAAELVVEAIGELPADCTLPQALTRITEKIRCFYVRQGMEEASRSPEYRCTASAIIYSAARQEVWQVGDCRLLTSSICSLNEKRVDRVMAEARAAFNEMALAAGLTESQVAEEDPGRAFIMPFLKRQGYLQNLPDASFACRYAVFDGYPVDERQVKVFSVSNEPEIVLASDGYPKLFFTWKETEAWLQRMLEEDPLCISSNKGTKGMRPGYHSYDDRTYLRIRIR